jgi:hypothetical protein
VRLFYRSEVGHSDTKRVISLHWNEDVADDRLDQFVAFATTHNWASSDRHDLEAKSRNPLTANLPRVGIGHLQLPMRKSLGGNGGWRLGDL